MVFHTVFGDAELVIMFPGTVSVILAWVFGLLGMTCLAVWPLFRTQKSMLCVQLGVVVGLSLHYALLGIATAAAVNALGAVQIALTLWSGGNPACVGQVTRWRSRWSDRVCLLGRACCRYWRQRAWLWSPSGGCSETRKPCVSSYWRARLSGCSTTY